MSFRVVKAIRVSDVALYADINITASDVGATTTTVSAANMLYAPGYIMGNGGGTAGQVMRLTDSANSITVASPDTPSNSFNIVGMLRTNAVEGVSASIVEAGRLDIFASLTIGAKYLGTSGLPVDSPPFTSAGSVRLNIGFSPHSQSLQFRIGEMKIN